MWLLLEAKPKIKSSTDNLLETTVIKDLGAKNNRQFLKKTGFECLEESKPIEKLGFLDDKR